MRSIATIRTHTSIATNTYADRIRGRIVEFPQNAKICFKRVDCERHSQSTWELRIERSDQTGAGRRPDQVASYGRSYVRVIVIAIVTSRPIKQLRLSRNPQFLVTEPQIRDSIYDTCTRNIKYEDWVCVLVVTRTSAKYKLRAIAKRFAFYKKNTVSGYGYFLKMSSL
jgi:hypothetical protein